MSKGRSRARLSSVKRRYSATSKEDLVRAVLLLRFYKIRQRAVFCSFIGTFGQFQKFLLKNTLSTAKLRLKVFFWVSSRNLERNS
jgi:hypothetical protein